jgi:hypothetical protein
LESEFEQHPRFRSPVIAALETCADRRLRGSGESSAATNGNTAGLDEIDRTVAIIEAVSAKIEADDLGALEPLFVSQALALDVMFTSLARCTPYDDIRLALRAQAQCRATLKSLILLKAPRAARNSSKRTIGNAE